MRNKRVLHVRWVLQAVGPIRHGYIEGNTVDKSKFLKVKLKTLMAESRIIHLEEGRVRDPELRAELHAHRVQVVRAETRATHIAYALIRRKRYCQVERPGSAPFDMKKVLGMLRKYGDHHLYDATDQTVAAWMEQHIPIGLEGRTKP